MKRAEGENSRNVVLLEDCITDYEMRAKTLITELNSALELDNPQSQVLVNPFAVTSTSYMSSDMSLSGQIRSYLQKGYSYWHQIIGDEYSHQSSDRFRPTISLRQKFWAHPTVKATFPNLSTIACHVSTGVKVACFRLF